MKRQRACCAPSVGPSDDRAPLWDQVTVSSIAVASDLIALDAGEFLMGTDSDEGYRADGEGPQRRVMLDGFSISACAVSNAEFEAFVCDTDYITEAERSGWSFVFQGFVGEELKDKIRGISSEAPWWVAVDGACWLQPEGPGSAMDGRERHPVTHISWHDAKAYCRWSGTRLPTEAEWEFASRRALEDKIYPWGEDWISPNYHRVTRAVDPRYVIPTGRKSMRGGSFLCHDSYCNRHRVAARSANTPASSTNHCGFRVAA